ncbi:MAG: DUF5666 domain-containing protein [Chloroflexi bacterium]|nr:DUF5666 domain-containing protein [Chloroflexota bacterium]
MTADPRADAFDQCLQRILNGEAAEQALAAYPQWAGEFRPMLETALAIHSWGSAIHAPNAAKARSRARFLSAALRRPRPRPAIFAPPFMRLAMAALAVWAVLLLGAFTTAAASARALPGDRLYPVKRLAENTRLALESDLAERMALEHLFDHERVDEVNALLAVRRAELVSFAGEVTAMGVGEWQVGGLRVLLSAATQVEAEILPGYYVNVQGLLQPDGKVLAGSISSRKFEARGTLIQTAADKWMLAGIEMHVSAATQVVGALKDGAPAYARGVLMQGGAPHAIYIESQAALPSATLAPLPSATLAPSPTLQPTPEATAEAEESPEPVETEDAQDAVVSPQPGDDEVEATPDSSDDSDDENDNSDDENDNSSNENENENEDNENDNEDDEDEDNDNEEKDKTRETPEDDDEEESTPIPTDGEDD